MAVRRSGRTTLLRSAEAGGRKAQRFPAAAVDPSRDSVSHARYHDAPEVRGSEHCKRVRENERPPDIPPSFGRDFGR
jgi:hypothetical protein